MAIKQYKEGEHGSGFIGYRVVTSGVNGEYVQKYYGSEIGFNIEIYGYDGAWKMAVDKFAENRNLTRYEKRTLLKMKLSKEYFTGELLLRVRRRGYSISKKELLQKLG